MIQIYTYGSPSLVKTTSSSIGRMRVPFDDPTQTQLLKSKRAIIAPIPCCFFVIIAKQIHSYIRLFSVPILS